MSAETILTRRNENQTGRLTVSEEYRKYVDIIPDKKTQRVMS